MYYIERAFPVKFVLKDMLSFAAVRVVRYLAYTSGALPLYRAWQRRDYDLLLVGIIIYTILLVSIAHTEYIEITDPYSPSPVYTSRLTSTRWDLVWFVTVQFGLTVAFVRSAVFMTSTQEWFINIGFLIVLLTIAITETVYYSLNGIVFLLSCALLVLFFHSRFVRDVYVHTNLKRYFTATNFFYAAIGMALVAQSDVDAYRRTYIDAIWIIFTNLSLSFFLTAPPPRRKPYEDTHPIMSWFHGAYY